MANPDPAAPAQISLTPAAREQLFRVARLFAVGLLAQPAVASLVRTTLIRYPLVMAAIAAVEVTYHELRRRRVVIIAGSRMPPPPPV